MFILSSDLIIIKYRSGIICFVGHWGMYTGKIGYCVINSKYFGNEFLLKKEINFAS